MFPTAQVPECVTEFLSTCDLHGVSLGILPSTKEGASDILERVASFGAKLTELQVEFPPLRKGSISLDHSLRKKISGHCLTHGLHGLLIQPASSMENCLIDRSGRIVASDVLGQIAAQVLDVTTVVAPRHVNSGLLQLGLSNVVLTNGDDHDDLPRHLLALQDACAYDAEGRFYVTKDKVGGNDSDCTLVYRDDHLPILTFLSEVVRTGSFEARVAIEPKRFTARVCLKQAVPHLQQGFMEAICRSPKSFEAIMDDVIETFECEPYIRISFRSGAVLHIFEREGTLSVEAVSECSSIVMAEARISSLIDAAATVSRLLECVPAAT